MSLDRIVFLVQLLVQVILEILEAIAEAPDVAGRSAGRRRRWIIRPPSPFKPERIQKTLRELGNLLLEMADGITVEAENAGKPAAAPDESPG